MKTGAQHEGGASQGDRGPCAPARSVSLPVLSAGLAAAGAGGAEGGSIAAPLGGRGGARGRSGPGPAVRASRMGRRRAVVLILVHVVIGLHIVQWVVSGLRDGVRETVSPVEPSEAMYTLEQGVINAGFIFFGLAILSTLILGRFFCGWGCHVVALQDLCAHWMKRLGVHPKPFRSRLLVLAPLALAVYMFVWPTFRRVVLVPLFGDEQGLLPAWMGQSRPIDAFTSGLIVEDFWATFPPWYVAIPFLAICGFACVYFLGSKGFCTYGCPYGGFFGPADALAPGRIRVTDDCHHCGHCTAVCTSNVRVHEEVRDFGMVVDPGCMKCMDCVSVCPNDALYFGFGRPALAARTRDAESARKNREKRQRRYDLRPWEEVAVAAAFVGVFVAMRGFLNSVPLLMAVGLAGVGAYAAWTLLRLVRDPHVRVQSLQLKYRGRWRSAGIIFAVAGALFFAAAAWSGVVRYHLWRASLADAEVMATREAVFGQGAGEASQQAALRAISYYERAAPPGHWAGAGIGWGYSPEHSVRLAWLSAVVGEWSSAERHLLDAIESAEPSEEAVFLLARVMQKRGAGPTEVADVYERILRRHPRLVGVRLDLVLLRIGLGQRDRAADDVRAAASADPRYGDTSLAAAQVLLRLDREAEALALIDAALERSPRRAGLLSNLGREMVERDDPVRGAELLLRAVRAEPRSPALRFDAAIALASAGRLEEAIEQMRRATRLDPSNVPASRALAEMLAAAGRREEADAEGRRADELQRAAPVR